jgi:GNAT superfamily N-acetyltransferase
LIKDRLHVLQQPTELLTDDIYQFLIDRFPRSLLILGDLEEPLLSLVELAVVSRRNSAPTGVGLRFGGFQKPMLVVVADDPNVGQWIVDKLQAEESCSAQAMLHSSEPVLAFLVRSHPVECDVWMIRATASSSKQLEVEEIRKPTALAQLHQLCGVSYWHANMLRFGHHFGARHHGTLVSASGVNFVIAALSYAQIANVITAPDQRGCGLASKAVTATIDSLWNARCSNCGLFVSEQDRKVKGLYARLGFRPAGRFYLMPA